MSGPCCAQAVQVARQRDRKYQGMIDSGLPTDYNACGSRYQIYLAERDWFQGRESPWTVAWDWLERGARHDQ